MCPKTGKSSSLTSVIYWPLQSLKIFRSQILSLYFRFFKNFSYYSKPINIWLSLFSLLLHLQQRMLKRCQWFMWSYERKRQWPVTDNGDWPHESSPEKNRIAFKIWTAVPRVKKYNIFAAVQILETIRFVLSHDDSITRGQPPKSVTGHWRVLSYVFIRPFSMHI